MTTKAKKIEHSLGSKMIQVRRENMRQFGDIEHRLEYVDAVNGVEYINDSKATDVNSTWFSLDSLDAPLVWIVESCSYDDDLSLYNQLDVSGVRAMIILGSNPQAVHAAFQDKLSLIGRVNTVLEAVQHAALIAEEGDTVLYSPACSDFEQFVGYKEKGQRFRKAVRELKI